MSLELTPGTVRPPVALGCFLAAAAIVAMFAVGACAVTFLESGANSGKVRLDVPEAYAVGSVEFVGPNNLFIVRLRDESFIAVSDLDAANRANQSRRCRIALTDLGDPLNGVRAQSLVGQMSPAAAGATSVFRESCNGAIYDIAGARLNGPGRNLDRFPAGVAADGHLVVDTSRRVCSERDGEAIFAEVECDQ